MNANVKSTVSATAVLTCGLLAPAFGQNAPQQLDEVVVTGSRIATGAQSPIPLTVMTTEEIQQSAPKDISDFVNQVPSIAGSMTPANRAIQISNGTGGLASPSVRGLGTNRSLVLLNGERMVQAADSGEVDIETFPQQLISRVEVVSGGASAVYGSDALTGVINFVLDTDFTGVKAEASGGITEYGDDLNGKMSLGVGFGFAGGRGHVLLSGEGSHTEGVGGSIDIRDPSRSWMTSPSGTMPNPAFAVGNGQPLLLVGVPNIGAANFTVDGLITGSVLNSGAASTLMRGTAFDRNGQPYAFRYGTVSGQGGALMSGGDNLASNTMGTLSFVPRMSRNNFFGRVSYDLTDNVSVYLQGQAGSAENRHFSIGFLQAGNLTVQADNAFLPESVRAQAQSLGIRSFTYGFFMHPNGALIERDLRRVSVGTEGSFEAFRGKQWNWNAHVSRASTDVYQSFFTNHGAVEYARAVDAVFSPTTGAIVCRSTLTNPGNGCVAYNIFGYGRASEAARNYVFGTSWREETFELNSVQANITGQPFSTWAGPVSMAFGGEHRYNSVESTVDEGSARQLQPPYVGRWYAANFFPLNGKVSVTEGYLETRVPLLANVPMAESLELSGAVRRTNYTTSGLVTTWKVGSIWSPIDDLRFRVTRSQDIRAPSLFELFSLGQQIGQTAFTDPLCDCQGAPASSNTVGNRDLKPEVAQTLNLGVVLQPRFLEGFTASVDYYRVDIKDAIGSLNAQTLINQCYSGNTVFCPSIIRTTVPGFATPQITQVIIQPYNFAREKASGLDIETHYTMPAARIFGSASGNLTFRALATHFISDVQTNGVTPDVEVAGVNTFAVNTPASGNQPNWKFLGSIAWSSDRITASFTGRGISSGVISHVRIVCEAPNCPTVQPTTTTPTVNKNTIPGAFYMDAAVTYRPDFSFNPELFLAVSNIADKDPVETGASGAPNAHQMTNPSLYDLLGRTYRVGFRMRM